MDGDFSRRLIEARARLGLTQGEFAARMGVSQGAVSRWEKGRHKPNAEVLMRLTRLGPALALASGDGLAASPAPPAVRMGGVRPRLRFRPIETPRRRLSDHLQSSIECALKSGRSEFVARLRPILADCLDADRRDSQGRRQTDRASPAARLG